VLQQPAAAGVIIDGGHAESVQLAEVFLGAGVLLFDSGPGERQKEIIMRDMKLLVCILGRTLYGRIFSRTRPASGAQRFRPRLGVRLISQHSANS
jgi:hypothetical protein